MMTRLTSQAQPEVLTRKQTRKAKMEALRDTSFKEATEVSLAMKVGKTAWVYLNTPLGGKASFFVRVSNLPEVHYNTPTPTLKLVAGFQNGKKTLG